MSEVLAIIPARGGSKSVPRKNLRRVAGRSLLARAIENAQRAHSISRLVVSTEDDEIAELAVRCGAELILRPVELSSDTTSSEAVLLHALEQLECSEDYCPELTVFLQCTAPLTLPADIDGCIELLRREQADSVFAAAPFHHFVWRQGASGDWEGVNHDASVRPMRQDRPTEYVEAGAVVVVRTQGFRKHRHRFFGQLGVYPIPESRLLDIDEPEDLFLADMLLAEEAPRLPIDFTPSAVALDFDGVLTDNRVLVLEDGREAVQCNRSDGLALAALGQRGLRLLILSGEKNPVVEVRGRKLGVPVLSGVDDKLSTLETWVRQEGLAMRNLLYVGNDMNDVACLRAAGLGVAPADAVPAARREADWVLARRGGGGVVREIADTLFPVWDD